MNKVSSMMNEHDVASAAQAFYDNDGKPYRRFFYEESPSETLLKTQPAGDNFADHPILQETLGSDNSADLLKCKRFRLQQDYILHEDGFYGDGELSVSKTTDSDKRTVFTFTDFRGNKILERIAIDNSTMADTYYIYDALGNLRFVLPPGLKGMEEESGNSWDIRSNEALRSMAYFYRYDRRLNCVEKKMPGTESVIYLYDKTGNAVFSQDGNQRNKRQWHFAVPDRFGRPVFEGLCSTPDSALLADTWIHAVRSGHNSTGNGLSMNGYEVNFPIGVEKLLTVKYYDNYDFMTMEGFSALPSYRSRGSAKGLLTGMATAVLPSDTCIFSAQWYDDEDRVNAYFTTNLIGGYDVTTTKYSFTGKPVSVKNLHRTRLVDVKYAYETLTNTYDSADRLVKSIKYIPRAGNITLAENTYDGLGRLATSKRNGNEAFTTTYRYNINGWLTDIQNPVFTENLFYEKFHNNSQAQYGGNISAVDWKVGGASDNGRTRGYTFRYDKMSRLIKADYFENGLASDHYSTAYGYDLMGNITSIKRNGLLDDDEFGLIDDLTLSYQGNQMVKVYDDAEGPVYKNAMHFADGTDKDVEYSYDANGNMTMDLNKNIESITYNSLGFPEHVKTNRIIRIESVRNENNIEYTYAADGRKLRVKYITTHPTVNREGKCLIPSFPVIKPSYYTFEYCGNWIFRDSTLHDILFDGGYISFERNTPHVHFYFRDHLGNVRVVTDRDGNIEQSNHYYPFGATFGESTNPNLQWFKYNGKELDTMYGLNLYDYSARAHDPLLGRFTTQDPLQEKCYEMSPYVYCVNSPVMYIDPDGKFISDYIFGSNGKLIDIKHNSNPDRVVVQSDKGKCDYYNFADPNDAYEIEKGVITSVVIVRESQIKDMLKSAGAFDPDNESLKYMYEESKNSLDFSYSQICHKFKGASSDPLYTHSPMLFIPEGDNLAHNHMNFGNFLWGAAGYALGFSKTVLRIAAHINSLFGRDNGYGSQFDSADDQLSISHGVDYSEKNDYRSINLKNRHYEKNCCSMFRVNTFIIHFLYKNK